MEENKIVHIEINDWNCNFKTSSCVDLIKKLDSDKNNKDFFFNYSFCNYDMAMIYFITTTEKDLIEHNLTELLEYKIDFDTELGKKKSMVTKNFYPKYNPSLWHTSTNGKYFNWYQYFGSELFLFVDEFGYERLSNEYPIKLEIYLETLKEEEKQELLEYLHSKCAMISKGNKKKFTHFDDVDDKTKVKYINNIPILNALYVPKGTIKQYCGHDITYDDDPIYYNIVNIENINIFEDEI